MEWGIGRILQIWTLTRKIGWEWGMGGKLQRRRKMAAGEKQDGTSQVRVLPVNCTQSCTRQTWITFIFQDVSDLIKYTALKRLERWNFLAPWFRWRDNQFLCYPFTIHPCVKHFAIHSAGHNLGKHQVCLRMFMYFLFRTFSAVGLIKFYNVSTNNMS